LADRDTLGKRPDHSHSVVSGTGKYLKADDFLSERANFTVKNAVDKFCLATIAAD
jgi:hypothetical protein